MATKIKNNPDTFINETFRTSTENANVHPHTKMKHSKYIQNNILDNTKMQLSKHITKRNSSDIHENYICQIHTEGKKTRQLQK